jgi:hypothetical protein
MAYDEKLVERVRGILSSRQDVAEKRMIGGWCFMIKRGMCCGVNSTGLLVRVGPEAYEQTLAQPHVRPMKLAGRTLTGFVSVGPDGCRTNRTLAKWVQQGIDFALTLTTKEPGANKPRPRHR